MCILWWTINKRDFAQVQISIRMWWIKINAQTGVTLKYPKTLETCNFRQCVAKVMLLLSSITVVIQYIQTAMIMMATTIQLYDKFAWFLQIWFYDSNSKGLACWYAAIFKGQCWLYADHLIYLYIAILLKLRDILDTRIFFLFLINLTTHWHFTSVTSPLCCFETSDFLFCLDVSNCHAADYVTDQTCFQIYINR